MPESREKKDEMRNNVELKKKQEEINPHICVCV